MLENSIVNKTSPEANWNRQTDRQTDRRTGAQDYVLSQADALTKNKEKAKKQEFLGPTYLIQKCFPFPFNLVYFDQC